MLCPDSAQPLLRNTAAFVGSGDNTDVEAQLVENDAVEECSLTRRFERALHLTALSIVSQSAVSYSVIRFSWCTQGSSESLKWLTSINFAVSFFCTVFATIYLLYLNCADHHDSFQKLIDRGFNRNAVFAHVLITFALLLRAKSEFQYNRELTLLTFEIVVALLMGLYYQLDCRCSNPYNQEHTIYAYSGLYFPRIFYLLIAYSLLIRNTKLAIFPVYGTIIAYCSLYACRDKCSKDVNAVIPVFTLTVVLQFLQSAFCHSDSWWYD